jgi:hypothetical protein
MGYLFCYTSLVLCRVSRPKSRSTRRTGFLSEAGVVGRSDSRGLTRQGQKPQEVESLQKVLGRTNVRSLWTAAGISCTDVLPKPKMNPRCAAFPI